MAEYVKIKGMPCGVVPFVDERYYHLYNRGVEKRSIFSTDRDYQRFLQTIFHYQFSNLKFRFSRRDSPLNKDFNNHSKLVEIICHCLMPNHFHLLVKQTIEGGVHKFMQKTLNIYTKYFNTKHKRVGPLLQGAFRAVSNKQPVLDLFTGVSDYEEFVTGHGDYAKELEVMKHLLMEEE